MYPNESCRSVECDRCMFTRRGTVIRTSSGRTSACLRGRVRMHSSGESTGAQRARGFRTCVFERANQLERHSSQPATPCPNRRTCSWTRVRFTRKLYGMIPKPLARTSAAGGRVLELAERLDTVEGPLRRAAFSHYEILDDSTDVRVNTRETFAVTHGMTAFNSDCWSALVFLEKNSNAAPRALSPPRYQRGGTR